MQNIMNAVQKHRQLMLDTLDFVWKHPETGYKEYQTNAYVRKIFTDLGYELTLAEDIPGFYTVIDTGREGPEILILGELDSLICANHPDANPETGAVHCCGHAAQMGALVGIAAALKEPGVLDRLCGRIRLCAVPAEELIELSYRQELKKKGTIRYFGGKTEFLHRGYFDGVDMAFMVHLSSDTKLGLGVDHVGCMAKKVTYKGRSAHAGGAPWMGCNALYAANLGLSAINAMRETFQEKDYIRVHPIMTNGGDVVNAIPEKACIESFVRGASFEAIVDANRKVNRALCGGALSVGTQIEIDDFVGYAPMQNNGDLRRVAMDAAQYIPELEINPQLHQSTGSTDMGDLSQIMPALHPTIPGAQGISHGADYQIVNPDYACVSSAKWQVAMLVLLLENGGERAKEIVRNFKPQFASRQAYLQYVDSLTKEGNCIVYTDDNAEVHY